MSLPTLSGAARLIADPDLRITPSGMSICKVRLVFNSRKKVDDKWVDDKSFYVSGTAFGDLAERIAEDLAKGVEVVITGRLSTDEWTDKETGAKRSAPALAIDSIGPSMRYAAVTVKKMKRSTGGNSEDPWWADAATEQGEAR